MFVAIGKRTNGTANGTWGDSGDPTPTDLDPNDRCFLEGSLADLIHAASRLVAVFHLGVLNKNSKVGQDTPTDGDWMVETWSTTKPPKVGVAEDCSILCHLSHANRTLELRLEPEGVGWQQLEGLPPWQPHTGSSCLREPRFLRPFHTEHGRAGAGAGAGRWWKETAVGLDVPDQGKSLEPMRVERWNC